MEGEEEGEGHLFFVDGTDLGQGKSRNGSKTEEQDRICTKIKAVHFGGKGGAGHLEGGHPIRLITLSREQHALGDHVIGFLLLQQASQAAVAL
jgi:hypothetical protein